ncbi:MAG: ABC transporter permease [Chloroflexi bacterium]|nr:ABC transporter permease [Chloroflexota bacterium]MBT7082073.1 ABC transporter permease [Chloroflexota bacterium]MBT7290396.1 ABC transporter permease [Chloroflexota bacterium]
MNWKWLIRRLGFMLMVLAVAVILNFLIPRLMPGSAKQAYAGKLPEAVQVKIIARFGLDKSIWEQFVLYIQNTLKGDLGMSFSNHPNSVTYMIGNALPWTLFLLLTATIITVPLGYVFGVIAGWRAGSKTDTGIQIGSLSLLATPLFWIAMVLLYVFSAQLGWFPLRGAETAYSGYTGLKWVGDVLWHAVLPVLALMTLFGAYEMIMRNTMVTTLRENYIITAEAKGASENRVKYKHAARNALLPLITSVGIRFATIVGGSVFVENIFSYPGIGSLIFDAVISYDFPLLQGAFLIFSIVTVVVVFLLDLVYLRLDPRIRY